jgi:hypothetical protein
MPMALMHAASAELGAGRVSDTDAGPALVTTILGAVSGGATDEFGRWSSGRAFRTGATGP